MESIRSPPSHIDSPKYIEEGGDCVGILAAGPGTGSSSSQQLVVRSPHALRRILSTKAHRTTVIGGRFLEMSAYNVAIDSIKVIRVDSELFDHYLLAYQNMYL